MKNRNPISLVAVTAATLLATAWLGRAGEVSYLETFETNILSDELGTAVSNGVLRAWVTLPPHNPTNALRNLRSLWFPHTYTRDLKQDRDLEVRADILRVTGEGGYAALGWFEQAIDGLGYDLLVNAQEIALVKFRFDQQIFSPFFWEPLPLTNRPMTVILRFSMMASNLSIQTQVVDQENPSQVIFGPRTVIDTPASEPISATPPPLQPATPDPGPPWQGTGVLLLSLFGANTNTARLEMEVDNFGIRQTLEVTADDLRPLIYTNAARQTLPYRLFIPTNQQPGTLYPLVLFLHGSGGVGNDNVGQLYDQPGPFAFVSPGSQARHPCFLVVPQLPAAEFQADQVFPWWNIRERVVGLVNLLQTRYPIDPDRVYIAGNSLGGIGTWSLTDTYTNLFAAAVPMSGIAGSDFMKDIAHLPIWAFHGARDGLIPTDYVEAFPEYGFTLKGTRGLIADLRRLGGYPIYTEYASAEHCMFGAAYDTPGLVDWLMAQRRGTPVQHSPWIAVTAPVSNGVWTTSYTNLDLAGTACADAGITNIMWRNENMTNKFGDATGTTNWVADSIPLIPGRISGTRVIVRTNVVTVTATGTSWSELYGGTTTFNTVLRVIHVPIRLRATIDGGQTRLDWSGAAPSFVVQRCTDLGVADWTNVVPPTSGTNLVLPHATSREFYRIRLP